MGLGLGLGVGVGVRGRVMGERLEAAEGAAVLVRRQLAIRR